MDARLKILGGAIAGQQVRLAGPRFFIGRAEDCQLRPKSEMVSRHHCVLLLEEESVVVRDLGSRNGTLVNGERVIGERELAAGDRLQVGPLEFEMLFIDAAAATKKPKVASIKEAVARAAETTPQDDVDLSSLLDDTTDAGESALSQRETVSADSLSIESLETEEIPMSTTATIIGPLPEVTAKAPPAKPATPEPASEPKSNPKPAPESPQPQAKAPPQPAAMPPTKPTAPPDAPTPPTESAERPAEPEPAKPSPPPAKKPPQRPDGKSGDSGDAAADAIRKFLRRR